MFNITYFRDSVRKYYENNDKGHQLDHADDVFAEAMWINTKTGVGAPADLIAAAAYSHDIYSSMLDKDTRKNHHILGKEWVMNNEYLNKVFAVKDVITIAMAVAEHRASYKGNYYSPLSVLLATADRGSPNLDEMIKRCLRSNGSVEALSHLKEKFGSNGYVRYTSLYREVYGSKIEEMQNIVDNTVNIKDIYHEY